MAAAPRLALAGAGRMGGALLKGWSRARGGQGLRDILVVEPDPAARAAAEALGCMTARELSSELAAELDTLVIAVKPQRLPEAAIPLAARLAPGCLVLSIAAGVTIATLQALFPRGRVVRAMPNLPAILGAGASAFVADPAVTPGQRDRARQLLSATGLVLEVASEAELDAVTALSGSGPAYVFLLAEAMAEAGGGLGLPGETARLLALATIAGAGRMLAEPGADAAGLRAAVASPGGTTEAALAILDAPDGLRPLMARALAAAARRAKELAD